MKQTISDPRKAVPARRAFLRLCARFALLGGLGFAMYRLFARRQVSFTEAPCVNRGVCSGCRAHSTCSLPQALSRRRAGRGSR